MNAHKLFEKRCRASDIHIKEDMILHCRGTLSKLRDSLIYFYIENHILIETTNYIQEGAYTFNELGMKEYKFSDPQPLFTEFFCRIGQLPFENIILETDIEITPVIEGNPSHKKLSANRFFHVLKINNDPIVAIVCYMESDSLSKKECFIDSVLLIDIKNKKINAKIHNSDYGKAQEVQDVLMLNTFFELLECSNVYIKSNKPDEKLNKKRKKKGKLPLFEYKTLEVRTAPKVIDQEYKGGTHASPRVHLRRGHIRRLSNGSKIWIDPMVVGSKENGMIHKDYLIK